MSQSVELLGFQSYRGTFVCNDELEENEELRDKVHYLYCLVFENDPERNHAAEDMDELLNDRKIIIDKVVEAGLSVQMFYSVQKDEIYAKIGATDERLLTEANLAGYKLPLNPEALRAIATSDRDPKRKPIRLEPPYDESTKFYRRDNLYGEWVEIGPHRVEQQLRRQTPYKPFEQLHAKYSSFWEKNAKEKFGVQVYEIQSDGGIVRQADRIKLCIRILERPRDGEVEGSNGAGLNLSEMLYKKKILATFPLPTNVARIGASEFTSSQLYDIWMDHTKPAWVQPLEDIRDYFGERIAFYLAFLGHYTMWLFPSTIVGITIFIHQLVTIHDNLGVPNFLEPAAIEEREEGNVTVVYSEVPESPYYALVIALWATFMIVFWKRKENRLALRWGQTNLQQWAKPRPEFFASHVLPSLVSGRPEKFYSKTYFYARLAGSAVVIGTSLAVVLGAFAGIFVLRVFLSLPEETGLDEELGRNLALVINALVIQLLGFLYKYVAQKLTDWENHRTQISYENSLVLKTFIFSFINSYATLFYMAFVKTNLRILDVKQFCFLPARRANAEDACFGNIGASLLIIFTTQLFVSNVVELAVPAILHWKKRRQNSTNIQIADDTDEQGRPKLNHKSPAEDHFYRAPLGSTRDLYLTLALQFGYVTLFVVAFPLAPVLAFVTNWIKIHTTAFQLCKLNRRPDLEDAENIGVWQPIFQAIGLMAVATNSALIVFVSDLLPSFPENSRVSPDAARVWVFLLFTATVLTLKRLADFFLPDEPGSVTIQLQREKFLIRKCLEGAPDHREEDLGEDVEVKHTEVPLYASDPQIDRILQRISTMVATVLASKEMQADDLFQDVVHSDNRVKTSDFCEVLNANLEDADEEMIETLAQALDSNSSGKIDVSEFTALVEAKADSDEETQRVHDADDIEPMVVGEAKRVPKEAQRRVNTN